MLVNPPVGALITPSTFHLWSHEVTKEITRSYLIICIYIYLYVGTCNLFVLYFGVWTLLWVPGIYLQVHVYIHIYIYKSKCWSTNKTGCTHWIGNTVHLISSVNFYEFFWLLCLFTGVSMIAPNKQTANRWNKNKNKFLKRNNDFLSWKCPLEKTPLFFRIIFD